MTIQTFTETRLLTYPAALYAAAVSQSAMLGWWVAAVTVDEFTGEHHVTFERYLRAPVYPA